MESINRIATDLQWVVHQVTGEEFAGQDRRFDKDSRHGRELLYLSANSDWVRSTVETVLVHEVDSVDTTLEVHVEIEEITHEVFAPKDHLFLPLLLLPGSPNADDGQVASPDITVTDASGALRSLMPQTIALRQVAAALAEIIVNIAASRRVSPAVPSAGQPALAAASREQMLVLAGAILRLIRGERAPDDWQPPEPDTSSTAGAGPLELARAQVLAMLRAYLAAPGTDREQDLLVARTAQVLLTFIDSQLVVVAIARTEGRTALRVQVPARALVEQYTPVRERLRTWLPVGWLPEGPVGAAQDRPRRPVRPAGRARRLRIPRRHATLTLDLLAPTSHSARDVKLVLPQGLSVRTQRPALPAGFAARIEVERPRPIRELAELLHLLVEQSGEQSGVEQSKERSPAEVIVLLELALGRIPAVRQVLRFHRSSGAAGTAESQHPIDPEVLAVLTRLTTVEQALRTLAVPSGGSAGVGTTTAAQVRETLREPWGDGAWLAPQLQRRTTVSSPTPRVLLAHAEAIDQVPVQAPVRAAALVTRIVATESPLFNAARYSSLMSIALILAVLVLFLVSGTDYNPEVLAGALTIFSAIQATRVEYPDRSTLHGRLSGPGYVLVVLSVLPTILLAMYMAFVSGQAGDNGGQASGLVHGGVGLTRAAAVALLCQVGVYVAMLRGPLSGRMAARPVVGLNLRTSPAPHHDRTHALHAAWWRETTAEALRLGRPAYAFVERQRPDTAASGLTPFAELKESQANVLSLLRAGTVQRALTFLVFSDEPEPAWARHVDTVPVSLDPNRLVPSALPTDVLRVYVGLPDHRLLAGASHPLSQVLDAAGKAGLVVVDVQLPVPAPLRRPTPGLVWAIVRIGVPEMLVGAIAPFLRRLRDNRWHPELQVWVQWVEGERCTRSPPGAGTSGRGVATVPDSPVLAEELDVRCVLPSAAQEESPAGSDAPADWLMLSVTATAHPGLEEEIITQIASLLPDLGIAGLSTGVLHGTTVVLAVGRWTGTSAADPVAAQLTQRFAAEGLAVQCEQWCGRDDWGLLPSGRVLLEVDLRCRDRPGLIVQLITGLQWVLRAVQNPQDPEYILSQADPDPTWRLDLLFARVQVVAGGSARSLLTLVLPPALQDAPDWSDAQWERAEQMVRRVLATRPEHGHPSTDQEWWLHHDSTVVRLRVPSRPVPPQE